MPDLVLMLLIFYGLQIALNNITMLLGFAQIDIDPLGAGIITLGFIYGAYFTETFRGAYLAVPKGNRSGDGLRLQRRADLPAHSVPGDDAFRLAGHRQQLAGDPEGDGAGVDPRPERRGESHAVGGKGTYQPFFFAIVAGVVYLIFTTVSNGVLLWLERRYSLGVKRAEL